jgi:hypothetical protein
MVGTIDINMSVSGSTAVSKTFQLSVDSSVVSTQTVSGTTATYALDTTKLSNAPHTLSLRVTDSAGGSATASMPFTVNNPVVQAPPPSAGTIKVYLTQPGSGAVVSGTAWVTVWLDNAAAGNKTYTLIAGGKTVWTETNGDRPATLPWNTALNANGTNTLTVNIKDSTGNTGSGSVSVWVAN